MRARVRVGVSVRVRVGVGVRVRVRVRARARVRLGRTYHSVSTGERMALRIIRTWLGLGLGLGLGVGLGMASCALAGYTRCAYTCMHSRDSVYVQGACGVCMRGVHAGLICRTCPYS